MNLSGCWLKVIEKTNLLPVGEIVYCFVDEGYQFRVKSSTPRHGVTEFIFPDDSKKKFIVLN